MTKPRAWFKGNGMVVELELTDDATPPTPIVGASPTCTIWDEEANAPVAGTTPNAPMLPVAVGSNVYAVTIVHGGTDDGARYRAQISVDFAGVPGFWDVPVTGVRREQ